MDQQNPSSSLSRTDRKTIEKNRRNHMKALYSQLNSLVQHQTTKESTSLPDQLDEAAKYIKKLQVSLERMREKKNSLVEYDNNQDLNGSEWRGKRRSQCSGTKSRVEIHEMMIPGSSALEVVLTTGLDSQFIFNDTIRALHEEGADVVSANFSVVNGDTVLHTMHCTIGGFDPSLEASRISVRLNKIVDEANMGY